MRPVPTDPNEVAAFEDFKEGDLLWDFTTDDDGFFPEEASVKNLSLLYQIFLFSQHKIVSIRAGSLFNNFFFIQRANR